MSTPFLGATDQPNSEAQNELAEALDEITNLRSVLQFGCLDPSKGEPPCPSSACRSRYCSSNSFALLEDAESQEEQDDLCLRCDPDEDLLVTYLGEMAHKVTTGQKKSQS